MSSPAWEMRRGILTPAYADAVLSLSPVGYWPLDEAAGTVARDLDGTNNGTYVGSPTLGVAGPLVGDNSTAVTFNGSSQYVNCGSGVAVPVTGITVALFVKATAPGTARFIASRGASNQYSWFLYANTNGSVLWSCTNAASTDSRGITTAGVLDGNWHFVVGKFDGIITPRLLVDAVPGGSASGTLGGGGWHKASTAPVEIAARSEASTLPGSLAHAAIWNRPLSDAEVRYLYDVALGRG